MVELLSGNLEVPGSIPSPHMCFENSRITTLLLVQLGILKDDRNLCFSQFYHYYCLHLKHWGCLAWTAKRHRIIYFTSTEKINYGLENDVFWMSFEFNYAISNSRKSNNNAEWVRRLHWLSSGANRYWEYNGGRIRARATESFYTGTSYWGTRKHIKIVTI